MQTTSRDSDFTDVLDTPEDILQEPRFLDYTSHFWEAPDGELYFRPWREFLLVPGHRGLFRLHRAEDARLIFNLLKLRNILAFSLVFVLIALGLVLLALDEVVIATLWPDALIALLAVCGAFLVGMLPINLWCLLLFMRQTRGRLSG